MQPRNYQEVLKLPPGELVAHLRFMADANRTHARQIKRSPLGLLWHVLRWRRSKRIFELEYNARWLDAAAERIERLTLLP